MSADQPFAPELVVAALNGAGARYVIVGGLAVAAHGVVRATRDLDLVPDPQPRNLGVVAAALATMGAEHPILGALTADNLAGPAALGLHTRFGEVHVLNRMPGTPPFADLAAERILVEITPRVDAPVAALRHIRRMKRASTRPRDVVDLAELEELHGEDGDP